MKANWLVFCLCWLVSATALADAPNFQEGVNYQAVNPAQPTDVKPGQIEVIEFFWYGCPHCYATEPFVVSWLSHKKPANVVFKRVAAAMPGSEFYVDAQAFFTAQVLGIGDKIHEPFFDAIHKDGQDDLRFDKDAIRGFFGKFGVAGKDFDATWDSFAVQSRMGWSQQQSNRYGVEGVPTFIVNGKWKTSVGPDYGGNSYSALVECVDFLVQKEEALSKPAAKKH